MLDKRRDLEDCLFHLVGLPESDCDSIAGWLGKLGFLTSRFTSLDDYFEAANSSSFIFPIAIFCGSSAIEKMEFSQPFFRKNRIRLVYVGHAMGVDPELLLRFCMIIEPPCSKEELLRCVAALVRCTTHSLSNDFQYFCGCSEFVPSVEGWQCPLGICA